MNKIWSKKLHNWLGMASALFLTVLLITGVLLNHPKLLGKNELHALAVHPSDPQKIYAGRTDGLFVSADAGRTWEEVPMLYPPENVVGVAFRPGNAERIYVLEKWGHVLASADGGAVWERLALPFDPQADGIALQALSVGGDGSLVLTTSNGWLISTDGKTWDASHFDPKRASLHRLALTLHNGYFFGPAFVWVYDFAAAALLILIVTGFYLWKIGRSAA